MCLSWAPAHRSNYPFVHVWTLLVPKVHCWTKSGPSMVHQTTHEVAWLKLINHLISWFSLEFWEENMAILKEERNKEAKQQGAELLWEYPNEPERQVRELVSLFSLYPLTASHWKLSAHVTLLPKAPVQLSHLISAYWHFLISFLLLLSFLLSWTVVLPITSTWNKLLAWLAHSSHYSGLSLNGTFPLTIQSTLKSF